MANSANLSNANDLSQRFALDVQGFDSLRAQAKQSPQAGAKLVAGQFDAMFTQMMLKSMRDATPEGGLFDSHTSKMYTSMLDQQLAQQMSSRGIGVADALMKQLMTNILTVQASVGGREQEIKAMQTVMSTNSLQISSNLADLTSTNMVSTISQFTQLQNALTGAQKAFVQLQNLSLFQYINP